MFSVSCGDKKVFAFLILLLGKLADVELAECQKQDAAQLAKVNKCLADTGKNKQKIKLKTNQANAKIKPSEKENAAQFKKMEEVCANAADFKIKNKGGTVEKTDVDGNGNEVTIFMGSSGCCPNMGQEPTTPTTTSTTTTAGPTAQELCVEFVEVQDKVDRIVEATANYKRSYENCKECLDDIDSPKCAGVNTDGKSAEGEEVNVTKMVDGEEKEDVEKEEDVYDGGPQFYPQSHAVRGGKKNFMLLGALVAATLV